MGYIKSIIHLYAVYKRLTLDAKKNAKKVNSEMREKIFHAYSN